MNQKNQGLRQTICRLPAWSMMAATALIAMGMPVLAGTDTYSGQTGSTTAPTTGNFTLGFNGNGSTGYTTPTGSTSENLIFNGSGSTAYTATDNISGAFNLQVLTLNSTATVNEVIAGSSTSNTLNFAGAAGTNFITQNGTGAFNISAVLNGSNGLTFNGTGGGAILISGQNATNFTSGFTVNSGLIKANQGTYAYGGPSNVLSVNGGTVDSNNNGEQINVLQGTGGTVTNSSATIKALNIFGTATGTYAGNITGALNIFRGSTGGFEVLSGTDSYTGTTNTNFGTLQFAKEVSLYNNNTAIVAAGGTGWTTTNILVTSGGTLAFNVGGAGEFTVSDIQTLSGLGTGSGGFENGSILGLDTTNAAGGNFIYGNALTNTNGGANVVGLTKLGTNTLTLSAANTYTGGTTISAGTLNLTGTLGSGGAYAGAITNNAAFIDNSASNQTLSGVISGTGTLTQNGTNTLTLNAANTYTGGTTVNGGTLALAYNTGDTATGTLSNNAPVTVNSGGTLQFNIEDALGYNFGASAALNIVGGTVTSANVANTTPVQNGGASFRVTLPTLNMTGGTLSSGTNNDGDKYGGSYFIGNVNSLASSTTSVINAYSVSLQSPSTFNVAAGTTASGVDLSVSSILSGFNGAAGGLTKTGAGTLALIGTNTYTGATNVNAGTLTLNTSGTTTAQTTGAVVGSSLVVSGDSVYADAGTANAGKVALGASNQIGNSTAVTLSGGTLALNGNSEGSSTGGPGSATVSATGADQLTLTGGTTSFLDFGASNSGSSSPITFTFSGYTGSGSLYIYNYYDNQFDDTYTHTQGGGLDQLFFGSNATPGQITNVYFVNPNGQSGTFQAYQLASGEVVAPEPSQWVSFGLGILGLGGLALSARKRKASFTA